MDARYLIMWVVLLGAGSSCGVEEAGPKRVMTESGRLVVTNGAVGTWTEESIWHVTEDLRIGTVGELGPAQFGLVSGVVVDASDRIYVLDGQAEEIRVFDREGGFLHTLGGRGAGPTEFGDVIDMDVSNDGELWVLDAGNSRYAVFDRQGVLISTYGRAVAIYSELGAASLDDGSYIEWGLLNTRSPDTRTWLPVRFVPPDRYDTLTSIDFGVGTVARGTAVTPWDRWLTGAAAPDGSVWLASNDRYEIHRTTLSGDTLLTITRVAYPAPVTTVSRDSVIEFFGSFGVDVAKSEVPTKQPIVLRIVDDGWKHLYVFSHEDGVSKGSRVDVFEKTGDYLGPLILPFQVDLRSDQPSPFATREHLYLRVVNELGVHQVARLRIER